MASPVDVASDKKAARSFIRQMESIARRISGKRLLSEGLEDYLDLQEKVFKLQMKIQKAIGEAKQRGSKDPNSRNFLAHLRHLRWQSRRLGDAIAWQALLCSRQVIYALAANDPVPIPPTWSDGHRGTFELARSLTGQEWGIPIVHDVTSVLRIGDITFMRPGDEVSDAASNAVFRTFELKTRVSEEVDEQGETVVDLRVTAIGNEPFPVLQAAPVAVSIEAAIDESPATHTQSMPGRRPDRRIEQQMARMDIATASKNAPLNNVAKVGDQHILSLEIEDEPEPHWKDLRRAIRMARRDGFAYFELGGFVGYSLIYNVDGVSEPDIQAPSMPGHIAGLTHEEIGDRNSITISALPDEETHSFRSKVLPFYLWEVPQRAIQDILRRRLVIVAAYNSGWMEKLLTDAGLKVIPQETNQDRRGFEVIATFEWEGEATAEYHSSVWEEMYIAVHEFRGPTAVIQRARAPISTPGILSLDDFTRAGQ